MAIYSWSTHTKWWFSIVFWMFTRGYTMDGWWMGQGLSEKWKVPQNPMVKLIMSPFTSHGHVWEKKPNFQTQSYHISITFPIAPLGSTVLVLSGYIYIYKHYITVVIGAPYPNLCSICSTLVGQLSAVVSCCFQNGKGQIPTLLVIYSEPKMRCPSNLRIVLHISSYIFLF